MSAINDPNDPSVKAFIQIDADSHFSIQNLPYGIFSTAENPAPRAGIAIGTQILDLATLEAAGVLRVTPNPIFGNSTLNTFLSLGRRTWSETRTTISELLRHDNPKLRDNSSLRERALLPMNEATLHLPIEVSGFSDFLLSKEHATNCVDIVGGTQDKKIWPNWHHLPMGYNSRASSVVVSGTPVRRPRGQMKAAGAAYPHYGICHQLDFELETALVIGKPNPLGEPIPLSEVEKHAFGIVLLNDWSARDIQQWEFSPLGAFNSKNFSTSISPWIVTLDALAPFRIEGPEQDPQPLPYLRQSGRRNIDAHLEAKILPLGAAAPSTICRTELRTIYWSFAQQLVYHTSAGCNMKPGDLLGSGTVSSSAPGGLGCLYEATRDGKQRIQLEQGASRMYLEDGDEVTLTGWCQGNGYRVGLGECSGRVLPETEA